MTDWKKIKTEYITSNTSYQKLAVKHGVPYSNICKAAANQKWTKSKKTYGNKVVAKAVSKRADRESDKLANLKIASDGMAEVLAKVLTDATQFNRHLVTEKRKGTVINIQGDAEYQESEDVVEKVFSKYDTAAIKNMTAAMKDLTTTMRNLYGLLTVPEQQAAEIAAARLVLDKQKASIGDDDKEETGVILIAEVMEDEEDGEEAEECNLEATT